MYLFSHIIKFPSLTLFSKGPSNTKWIFKLHYTLWLTLYGADVIYSLPSIRRMYQLLLENVTTIYEQIVNPNNLVYVKILAKNVDICLGKTLLLVGHMLL